jgi:hypothetical protein
MEEGNGITEYDITNLDEGIICSLMGSEAVMLLRQYEIDSHELGVPRERLPGFDKLKKRICNSYQAIQQDIEEEPVTSLPNLD